MVLCFLVPPPRISSSLQASPGRRRRVMTFSRSSTSVSTVPRANWSSWWRTSTTAPPPRPPTPPSRQRRLRQRPTAASTVPRRSTATSGETPHAAQPRPHVGLTSGDAAHEQPAAASRVEPSLPAAPLCSPLQLDESRAGARVQHVPAGSASHVSPLLPLLRVSVPAAGPHPGCPPAS